jgi:type IV secretory pathway virB4 component-like protein
MYRFLISEKFGKKNPHIKKRIIVDEAWMMMASNIKGSEFTSDFLENMSRRIRKRNGALVVSSQKVDDFANSIKGQAIISNAHTTFLLSHEASDKNVLKKAFALDEGVVDNIIEAEVGRILLKQGSQLYLIQSYLFQNEKITATTNNG